MSISFESSKRSDEIRGEVREFIDAEIRPIEADVLRSRKEYDGDWKQWSVDDRIEVLKKKARERGLWNLFLPDESHGRGLSNVDYAPIAEEMGHSLLAPEIFNCNAPDTGNMEVLHKYGTEEQKQEWLNPLLAGEIRSVFCMTEPDNACSDATNVSTRVQVQGDEVVVDGMKWWSTGIGHPQARIAIVLGKTAAEGAHRHAQHTFVLVPLDTPGVEILRMLPVFGSYDAPYGHGEVHFKEVRVPKKNLIGNPGQGFALAQGRLGPGRIHHCMRCIGAAEEALQLTIKRASERQAFGKAILQLGGNRERIAEARVAIEQARLLTLHAAWKLDTQGVQGAMIDVAAIKVVAPRLLQQVSDMAMQIFGGAGLSHETILPGLFLQGRALRLADGPDEVHLGLVARAEIARQKSRVKEEEKQGSAS